ncbi:efflux RND transporter permease subunit [Thaumasiovibrio subtropicus]|uniref:efflux RND transporter permease subunit n=1 Tax=Thaumasiovibrio subtropicus TaxID=1891207 RepID=UPI000B34CA89|nr:efflux RND transporter permease subunit [Thaumasiovibrio subtropicus]
MMNFILRQRTFIAFFCVLCVIGGVLSYIKLGKLEDPSFTVKTALVVTLYPGATAQEVELHVTDKIEAELQSMESLFRLRSLSRPGVSMIFVDLASDLTESELPQQWDLLRRKVNDNKLQLPLNAQVGVVMDEFSEVYGMLFAISGEGFDNWQLRDYAHTLQRKLNTINGIKKVELLGVQSPVINIDIPNDRLVDLGLSPLQVITQLQAQDARLDAGSMVADGYRMRVDHPSELHSVSDVENLMLKSGVGLLESGMVRLGDIADVDLAYQEPAQLMSRFNGKDAIVLAVSPADGINVVSLGDTINSMLANYEQQLPVGIDIETIAFQPDEVDQAINNFISNLLQSLGIVVVVLCIFMGWRSSMIVGISLLLTILLTLIYMYFDDVDLQRVSLGTFILALGMLVDNAIVIVDLFSVKCRQGIERHKAAAVAVKEMAVPLLGATIIAICGALPVLLSKTESAEFALSVFQVMCASLLFSWVVAMVVTPIMCLWWIHPKETAKEQESNLFWRYFQKAINWTVLRPKTVLVMLVPLLIATMLSIPYVKVNFMPGSTRPIVFLDYWLPNGADIAATSEDMKGIEQWLLAQPEVSHISAYVGGSAPRFSVTVEPEPVDPAYGQILITTHDFEGIAPLIARGDEWLKNHYPQAEPRFRPLKMATADKFSLEARFIGPDPEVLRTLTEDAKSIMASHPNTKYIRDDWRQTSKVLRPEINLEAARRAGISRTDIAAVLRAIDEGLPIANMHIHDRQVPIKVRINDVSLDSLASVPMNSVTGKYSVPLGQVVRSISVEQEQNIIWRRNRLPVMTAQADVFGTTPSEVHKDIRADIEAIPLPAGYSMEWGGEYYDEARSLADTFEQLPKAGIVMVVILVALFNGLRQPIIILITVPLAAIGSTFSLIAFDKPFGFMALTGAICLSGMIIKNGIVLMDQINIERKKGMPIKAAIVEATTNRTLAISMGALTTALGMIPLMSDALFDQMAATIIGGLIAATGLALFVMPALYAVFFKEKTESEKEVNHAKSLL